MYKILAILGILFLALPIANAQNQNQTGAYNSTGTPARCFEGFAFIILESSSKPQPKTAQPATIISQDSEVKKFISDFCNFYHEKTGTWFRMTGEGFNQSVMKEFWTKYPIPAELNSYIVDTQQANKTRP